MRSHGYHTSPSLRTPACAAAISRWMRWGGAPTSCLPCGYMVALSLFAVVIGEHLMLTHLTVLDTALTLATISLALAAALLWQSRVQYRRYHASRGDRRSEWIGFTSVALALGNALTLWLLYWAWRESIALKVSPPMTATCPPGVDTVCGQAYADATLMWGLLPLAVIWITLSGALLMYGMSVRWRQRRQAAPLASSSRAIDDGLSDWRAVSRQASLQLHASEHDAGASGDKDAGAAGGQRWT